MAAMTQEELAAAAQERARMSEEEKRAADDAKLLAAKDARQNELLGKAKQGLAQDMAEGRARGQELFAAGSLGTRDAASTKADLMDILAKRKAAAEGFTGQEQTALKEQALGAASRQQAGAMRSLRAQQAASGVRGGLAGAQVNRALQEQGQQRAGIERDLLLNNLQNRQQNLGAYEQTVGSELGRQQQEKYGQLGTEMGYAQLGSAERSAVAQQAIAEQQASAAREQARKSQGKK